MSIKPLVLVTGGQRGIGLGISTGLVDSGYQVAITSDLNADEAEVQSALEILGASAAYYQHDLGDTGRIDDLLDDIETSQGNITSLVSNAGVASRTRGDLLELTVDDFDFVMDINLKGGFFLAQRLGRRMLAQRSDAACYRSMVFVTSVSAEMVSIDRAEYCISKAAASMMTRLFAARFAEPGIGVFEIRPGIIETSMTAAAKDKYDNRIDDGLVPAGRWGYPKDVASVVLPLIKGEMLFATGAVIPVDGGLTINRL